jgi:NTE family protein
VNGHRYMDGGMRSPANVDLARGAERVVVLAPLTQSFSRASRPARQLAALGPGVRSVLVSPDEQALRAIGKNVLDPANRAPAAGAGRVQGGQLAERVRAVWAA